MARFKGRDAALQALDFVGAHGDLTDEQADLLAGKFPLTTLDRLLSTPAVRAALGFEIKDGKLQTELPPEEALKPLTRIIIDLAEKRKTVTDLKSKDQQVAYISGLKSSDKPNMAKKTGVLTPVEGISENDFKAKPTPAGKKERTPKTPARNNIVPRNCKLNVTTAKIQGIYDELRTLQLAKHVHAISVLLRVFLEMSVDEYLTKQAGSTLTFKEPKSGRMLDKNLRTKVKETIDHMVLKGADAKDLKGVSNAMTDDKHPFAIDTLHAYIHNRFFTDGPASCDRMG